MPNNNFELCLDHAAIQVRDLEPAIELFSRLFGYHQATVPTVNSRHQVEVVFLEKDGSLPLKLICPVDPQSRSVAKLHHLAFRTDSLDQALGMLVRGGARVLNPPAPGEAFDDEPIAFLFAGGLNFELIATKRRSGRLAPPESGDGQSTRE